MALTLTPMELIAHRLSKGTEKLLDQGFDAQDRSGYTRNSTEEEVNDGKKTEGRHHPHQAKPRDRLLDGADRAVGVPEGRA